MTRTWALHRALGVLRLALEVRNTGAAPLAIRGLDTVDLRLAPTPGELELSWLNNYCRGLLPRPSHPVHRRTVGENTHQCLRTGPYGPDCAWLMLRVPEDPDTLVAGWEWSGPMEVHVGDPNFLPVASETAPADPGRPCALRGGLDSNGMEEILEPGESLAAPGFWMGFAQGGVEEAARLSWRYTETVHPALLSDRRYPYLGYCTWSDSLDGEKSPYVPAGTNPWFPTEENVLSQVRAAAELGFDLFILDYGWFPRVGDWRMDPDRFPQGPRRIVRAVKDAGMRLGLWMGFAAADPESRVAREHPEWLATYDGKPIPDAFPYRCSAKVWNTRVLCLGHEPVVEWATGQIHRVMEELEVDWFKHDFDTLTLCRDTGHTHTPGDGRIASCRGFYDILEHTAAAFPALILDNWESDSALPDYGMIARHQVHLIGDAYSSFLLRQMFYGASRLFPPYRLHRYLRMEDSDTDPRTALRSAMVGGPLTILSDPRKWSSELTAVFRQEADLYREVRSLFRRGIMSALLGRPTERGWDAFQFTSPGRDRAVVFVFRNSNLTDQIIIRLRDLRRDARYRVRAVDDGAIERRSGARLMETGVAVHLEREKSSSVLFLDKDKT